MRIIDLLNKIANGEEVPRKIKYRDDVYIQIDNYCYYCNETNLILSDKIFAEKSRLNDTVKILEEENKIEKINLGILNDQKQKNKVFKEKINLLIDEINKLKEDK